MKQLLFSLSICSFLLLSACNKQNTGNSIVNNSWTYNGKGYTPGATKVATVNKTVTATNGTAYITFSFNNLPTDNGMYNVVAGKSVHVGEIGITASTAPSDTFRATGNDHIQAKISVVGEKIIIQLPSTWLKNIKNNSDSVSTTAFITETDRADY
jgi:hypothetical protein